MEKREILFRGKRTDNGKWVEGLPGYDINGQITEIEVFNGFACCYAFDVDPETVCQDTGLTDKNGRKIFDGDIVKYGNSTHKVVFENRFGAAYFGIIFEDRGEVWSFGHMCSSLDMVVIGNIIDNPELLDSGGYAE